MYPYQRTPMGNPYIVGLYGYTIPKNPIRAHQLNTMSTRTLGYIQLSLDSSKIQILYPPDITNLELQVATEPTRQQVSLFKKKQKLDLIYFPCNSGCFIGILIIFITVYDTIPT